MKNVLESFAIFLVGLLSLGIVYFIIQYNMIDDQNTIETINESAYTTPVNTGLESESIEDDSDLD